MSHLDKALKYVREHIDFQDVRNKIVNTMEMLCPFSVSYPTLADDIVDLLEEYGEDKYLPECWWCEYGDIDDIIVQI